jgi:hypothetical protein
MGDRENCPRNVQLVKNPRTRLDALKKDHGLSISVGVFLECFQEAFILGNTWFRLLPHGTHSDKVWFGHNLTGNQL